MKNKTKIVFLSILLVFLIPIPHYVKDGGTIEYKGILYSVSKVHRLTSSLFPEKYEEGLIVKILGIEIFNNVQWLV